MDKGKPSRTALRVAMRRAAHQVLDDPKVYCDPVALRMAGGEVESLLLADRLHPGRASFERHLRAFLAARSRYTEDVLHLAVRQGVHQYVVLGAGLDTFAYRNPFPEDVLHVFEVDHPSTQVWKQARLRKAGIPIPRSLTFTAVDFETETLEEGLGRTGFDVGTCTLFSWLGCTVYLPASAVTATLRFAASMPAGSGIVFDYMVSPALLNSTARRALDGMARRAASDGEPFQTFFDPSLLEETLGAIGFVEIEDLGPQELNDRYFRGRTDNLRVGSLARIMYARVLKE